MCRINDDHTCSHHHPHVGPDHNFYVGNIDEVMNSTYNKWHSVITENGPENKFLHGLKPSRVRQLEIGSILQSKDGPREVVSVDVFEMPPETQLYHLVVDNSHTYIVEGYAVTGWPREDDFDYDTWTNMVKHANMQDYFRPGYFAKSLAVFLSKVISSISRLYVCM
jgi:hypothetical protein